MIYSVYRRSFSFESWTLAAETCDFEAAILVVMFLKRTTIHAVYQIKDDLGNDMMKQYPELLC